MASFLNSSATVSTGERLVSDAGWTWSKGWEGWLARGPAAEVLRYLDWNASFLAQR